MGATSLLRATFEEGEKKGEKGYTLKNYVIFATNSFKCKKNTKHNDTIPTKAYGLDKYRFQTQRQRDDKPVSS